MSYVTVNFLDKDYSIPEDVIAYVELVDFTNEIKDCLNASFMRQIRPGIDVIESDNFMIAAFNDQVSKFIRKLLDNDIYNRTANDYLQNNKGYELFLDTKKKVLRQLISIRKEKLETYRAGVEGAIYRKEASVTGLDFGIISGSFVNHMIYAYMDASKQTKQEQEALKTYNREIAELDKQAAEYDRQENAYIADSVIPAMNTVFTFFAYELLDKYVSDLIKAGKFDKTALDFIDLERSNDLLKNLELSNNRKAIIESAFVACPFNIAVYMQAMKYNLLDYDSFLAADSFKQGDKILDFLKESIGVVAYPKYAQPNLHSASLLSCYSGKSVEEILFQHTTPYANAVFSEYSKIVNALNKQGRCYALLNQSSEDDILAGENTSKRLANSLVKQIVPNATWRSLVEQCGHADLFDKLVKLLPEETTINSKEEYDDYLIKAFTTALEEARNDLAQSITAKRARAEEKRQKAEKAQQKKRKKTTIICCIVAALIIVAVSLPSMIESIKLSKKEAYIEAKIQEITVPLEQKIESQITDDIIVDYSYSLQYDWSDEDEYQWSFCILMNKFEEYIKSGADDDQLLRQIMDNCIIIQNVFDEVYDDLDFDFDYGEERIVMNYEYGSLHLGAISTYETFYYEEYGGNRYLHSHDTEYVLDKNAKPKKNTEDTVETVDRKSGFSSFEVNGLRCYVPADWKIYRSADGTVGKGSHMAGGKTKGSWYIKYYGEYGSILECVDDCWSLSESFPNEFRKNYEKIELDYCDEVYTLDETDEDGYRSVSYFVLCNRSAFFFQYFKYDGYFDESEMLELLEMVDFKSYTAPMNK